MYSDDISVFLNNWLATLSYEQRTNLFVGGCPIKTEMPDQKLSPRLTDHLCQPEYEVVEEPQPRYLLEPKRFDLPVQNNIVSGEDEIPVSSKYLFETSTYLNSYERVFLPDEEEYTVHQIVIVDNLYFDDEYEINNLTTITVHDTPPANRVSRLRRWARKTFKRLQKTFVACCMHIERDDEL